MCCRRFHRTQLTLKHGGLVLSSQDLGWKECVRDWIEMNIGGERRQKKVKSHREVNRNCRTGLRIGDQSHRFLVECVCAVTRASLTFQFK